MSEFEPGDDVEHDEYGPGTVKEHPDGRNGTYVYFDELKITTIMRVPRHEIELASNDD